MKIMLVGGGSGGHLTPLLAVAEELKRIDSDITLTYVGHKGDNLHSVVGEHSSIDKAHVIFAGKLRRYHGEGWRQLFDVTTMLKNLRDSFYLLLGLLQSVFLLRADKPDVVFIKGGFVGVPVGWAARLWQIPYLTHDSDVLPGLANRILAKKARAHAVAMPKHLYSYPSHKTKEVGIPISKAYKLVTKADKTKARKTLGIPSAAKVLFVSGGGLGAQRLNSAVVKAAPEIFEKVPSLYILHQAGQKHQTDVAQGYQEALNVKQVERTQVFGFTDKMADLSAAADLAVTRAGATAMAELAVQGKAVIMVPNPMLTGGHQLKNA